MPTPVFLVRLHFFGRFSSFFSLASYHYYSLHCLSFVSSFSITAPMTFSALFLYAFPFPLGISLAFLTHPLALSLPQDCSVLLPFAFSITGCFVSLALLSGSPGFWAFLRVFLGHYRLSSTSSTAVHFYPLSCSPLGSFPRLSSSSTPFRVFFCLPQLPGGFALVLLSFHQFICVFRFHCPFSWYSYLRLVHLYSCYFACSPHASWQCLMSIGGFGFFSSSFPAFSSLICLLPFSLWLLVLYVWGLPCL